MNIVEEILLNFNVKINYEYCSRNTSKFILILNSNLINFIKSFC